MSLSNTQRLLVDLATDRALRREWETHLDDVCARYDLGPLSEAFRELDVSTIESFARTVVRKRARIARACLPKTAQSLGNTFFSSFVEFADTPLAPTVNRTRDDALAFARFLERRLARSGSDRDASARAVLRYERRCLAASRPTFRLTCLLLRLEWAALQGLSTDDSRAWRPRIAVWFRPGARGRLRHWIL